LGNGGQRPFIGGATAAEGNIISGNPAPDGIRIYPGVHYAFISNNRIGTDASGVAPLGNRGNGVSIEGGEHSFVQGNTIAFNGATGVKVGTSCNNSIRRNSIHSNDEGGIVLADGGNDMLPAPVITSARPTQVSGTACPGCTVEVFSDDVDQGRVYEGTTVADALGRFTFSSPGGLTGPFITATATDGEGNTSDFSSPMAVGESVYLPLVLKAWKGKPE
jgi:parallel beta-helix repeat protein